jgi:hypothetical protein
MVGRPKATQMIQRSSWFLIGRQKNFDGHFQKILGILWIPMSTLHCEGQDYFISERR